MRFFHFSLRIGMAYGLSLALLSWPALGEESVGDKFRKVIADIDARCKREKRGPYLDRNDPEYRKKVADTSCDILRVQPRDWRDAKFVKPDSQPYPVPADWLSTSDGRFAHSIKLPSPHDKPKDVYRTGMTAGEYFQALCREEAGEFVFQTKKQVELIFEIRPRPAATPAELLHLFSMEDPYGYVNGETSRQIGSTWTGGNVYRALERPVAGASGFERVSRRGISERSALSEPISAPTAAYAFAWRGVVRPRDRENGIAGGELIAVDLQSKAVLGFRRGFVATGVGRRGVSWEFATVCPKLNLRGGRSKDFDFGLWFVSKVLQPNGYEKYREEISPK